jgi:eukaryotic translation initiation factor 2C
MHIHYKTETGIEQKAAFPKRVIVFRDGVSEGQFKQVIEGEIPKIKGARLHFVRIIHTHHPPLPAACASLNLPVEPKLTVVVVGKRHHGTSYLSNCYRVESYPLIVRFFPQSGQGDRSGNCPAGLVVDSGSYYFILLMMSEFGFLCIVTEVASPAEFDFYLQSHAGLLGTSRPAHYNVLHDENNFTADSMQQLAFALCHVYARSTRSVSIPAPVYCTYP